MTTIVRRKKLGMSSVREICAASKTGIAWVRNDQQLPEDSIYIRWGCTSNVPAEKTINSAKSIHRVNDKRGFRDALDQHALCPRTWFDAKEVTEGDLPVIVRPAKHAQGRRLHVCNTLGEVVMACARYKDTGYYISKLINKVAEYRVFVIQGKVGWVANKIPGNPNDIAWNVARGGKFENVPWGNWDLGMCERAIEAWKLSGLHFGGVDIMVDESGTPYVLEINSAPSLTSPYRQESTAKTFDWMVTHSTEVSPTFIGKQYGNWRDLIHPGLWPRKREIQVSE